MWVFNSVEILLIRHANDNCDARKNTQPKDAADRDLCPEWHPPL